MRAAARRRATGCSPGSAPPATTLDDETRRLPLTTFHQALRAFAEVTSREAIADTWQHLIADDNLGVWMRAIRGTRKPEESLQPHRRQ